MVLRRRESDAGAAVSAQPPASLSHTDNREIDTLRYEIDIMINLIGWCVRVEDCVYTHKAHTDGCGAVNHGEPGVGRTETDICK